MDVELKKYNWDTNESEVVGTVNLSTLAGSINNEQMMDACDLPLGLYI